MATAASSRRPSSFGSRDPSRVSAWPLRDWKRAFALVDALKSQFGHHAWFHGVRAFWDAHRDAIRIEVETRVPVRAPELLSPRLVAHGVGIRCVGG